MNWSLYSAIQTVILIVGLSVIVKLRLTSYGISTVHVELPDLESLPLDNRLNGRIERIGVNDLIGPESLAITKHNGVGVMFAGLADGRVVRITESSDDDDDKLEWTTVARTGSSEEDDNDNDDEIICGAGGPFDVTNTERTCGRPLGIIIVKCSTVVDASFFAKNDLPYKPNKDVIIVADTKGLLMISGIHNTKKNDGESFYGKVHVLATRAETDPEDYTFRLLNDVVQTPDGSLYITETSTNFARRRIFHAVLDGNPTGRLLRYRKNHGVEVMVDNLHLPNGITQSHKGNSLLVVTNGVQIRKFNLDTQQMDPKPFVNLMPATGDNIKTMYHLPTGESRRCYWTGYGSKFAKPFSLLKALSNKPMVRSIIAALIPYGTFVKLIPKFTGFGVYGEDGELIETYQDGDATFPWISEAEPMGEYIYLGTWFNPFLGRVKKQDLLAAT